MNILIVIFLLLSFSINTNCQEIKWWFDTYDMSFGQTAAADIDGDGKLELVFGCYRNDSSVYALNAEDGTLLWRFNASSGTAEGCNDTAPLIYDIDDDGNLDVIIAASCNPTTFCLDGRDGGIKWTARTRGSDSPPTIADIDGDGKLEILHGEFGGWLICIDARSGAIKWEFQVQSGTWIQTAPTLVDLDNDGLLDIVVATWCLSKEDTNRVYAFRGYDRELLWTFDLPAVVYHGTSIADLVKDGTPELVLGDYSGTLYAINGEEGSLKWSYTEEGFIYIGSPAIIGDINGDGYCEIIFGSAYHITALTYEGKKLWQYRNPNNSYSFRGVALSDIDGDNLPDVIYGTNIGELIVLKGTSGDELYRVDLGAHYGGTFKIDHAPIISDFDNDGVLDAFVVGGYTEYPDFYKNYGRAYAVSLGKGGGPDWLMFQHNIHRTGSLCYHPTSIDNVDGSSSGKDLIIYPNPFSGTFSIELGDSHSEIISAKIIDLLGRAVLSFSESEILNRNKISRGEGHSLWQIASPGLYIIYVETNKGVFTVILVKSD